jgi:RimJ/RimL family protein N-acetyltransferase
MKDLFRGVLVRVTAEEPDVLLKEEFRLQHDSEYVRLMSSNALSMSSQKKLKEWMEKRIESGFVPERYYFSVRTLAEDKLIGFFSLYVELIHSNAWVGIGIGDRDFWSKGYGTDMMKVCLRYAFDELGMQRVSLGLHGYNTRALHSYEKAGFKLEGRSRQDVLKEGKRTDTLWMGILREEWLRQNGEQP